jgi:hypothetical protein
MENIKVTIVDNTQSALKITNSDYTTIAYLIPREQLCNNINEKGLMLNSIYFLFGYHGTECKCYVGQAKKRTSGGSVLVRLREHDKSNTEEYRNIWQWALIVTNKDDLWGSDTLDALESYFIDTMPEEANLNGRKQCNAGADNNKYLDKILQIKNYLSYVNIGIYSDLNTVECSKQGELVDNTPKKKDNSVEDIRKGKSYIPEIVTPEFLVSDNINMIHEDKWNDKTVFIDIACKSGAYLKEIFNILDEKLKQSHPDDTERKIHILKYQLYAIALSKEAKERIRISLFGYDDNIILIDSYTDKMQEYKRTKNIQYLEEIEKTIQERTNIMTFDVVVGNPPYNKGLYKPFITLADRLIQNRTDDSTGIVSMITPANWCDTHDDIYDLMIKKCRKIKYFPDTYDCFDIKQFGGISVFMFTNNNNEQECQIENYWTNNKSNTNNVERKLALSNNEICLLNKGASIVEKY